jgi:hypothetical protein
MDNSDPLLPAIYKAMFDWQNSGYLAGTRVDSYHPQIADPQTGVPVYYPAQITTTVLPANTITGTTTVTTTDFNINDKLLGPNSSNVLKNIIPNPIVPLADRVIPTVDDSYYQQPLSSTLSEDQKMQFSSNTDSQLRQRPCGQVMLTTTNSPIGIPGLLNAYLAPKTVPYVAPTYTSPTLV